jgi:hypothetical protein
MDELARWIGEQLDADAAMVEQNRDGRGLSEGFPDYRTYSDEDTAAADEYIEHFGPARMLREIEAKRQIIDEHDTEAWKIGDPVRDCQWTERPCRTLRLLALPYTDRPGFREEWRP